MKQAEIIRFHTRHQTTPDNIALSQVRAALLSLHECMPLIAASSYPVERNSGLLMSGAEATREIAWLANTLHFHVESLQRQAKQQQGA